MNERVADPAAADAMNASAAQYLQLAKPRLLGLALATTLVGFALGTDGPLDHAALLAAALAGAALIGAGANALNQVLERDVDARMRRTAERPLPSGRLRTGEALAFGVLAAASGGAILAALVNPLTALLGAATFFSYVLFYTPLKRVTPLNTFVGAIPGALPAVMGWTAAGRALDAEALALFLLIFVWQLPHFYSIAWVHREDYVRSGLRMVTGEDPDGRRTARRILFYSAVLVPVSLLPALAGLAGWAYSFSALLAGVCLLGLAARLGARRMEGAQGFASASILYLMTIIVTLMADKT